MRYVITFVLHYKRPTVYVSQSLSSGGDMSREVAKRPGIKTFKGAKRPDGKPCR